MKKIIFIFIALILLSLPRSVFGIIWGIGYDLECGQTEEINPFFATMTCRARVGQQTATWAACGLGGGPVGLRVFTHGRYGIIGPPWPRSDDFPIHQITHFISKTNPSIFVPNRQEIEDCMDIFGPDVHGPEDAHTPGDDFYKCEMTRTFGPFDTPGYWDMLSGVCVSVLCETGIFGSWVDFGEPGDIWEDTTTCIDGPDLLVMGRTPEPEPHCGSPPGVIDKDKKEECDGNNLDGKRCEDFVGYIGGTLACNAYCQFDFTRCVKEARPPGLFVCPGDYCPAGSFCLPNPFCGTRWLEELVEITIVDFAFYLGLVLLPLIIIISAFLWITAAGDAKKIQQGQNLIKYGLIGFFFILLARVIIEIIIRIIRNN